MDNAKDSYAFLLIENNDEVVAKLSALLNELWPDCAIENWDPILRGLPTPDFIWQKFDVVFMGNDLGIGQALDFIHDFRLSPLFPPCVMVAVDGDELLAAQATRAGVDYYLPFKGITPKLLSNAVIRAEKYQKNDRPVKFNFATHVRGYRLLKRIGHGSSGILYLALRHFNRGLVVIKLVYEEVEGANVSIEFLLNEYSKVRKIDHPNVISIFEQGRSPDTVYIVMEYCGGGDMANRLNQGRLEKSHALYYFLQIAGGLEAVHQAGIIHCDLKPENILIRSDGSLAIIDFGIAQEVKTTPEMVCLNSTQGTVHYMSPEQSQGKKLDQRSDIYSLGCIFYELLTGEKPYYGGTPLDIIQQQISQPVPSLPQDCREYQRLLELMMAKSPTMRFATVGQLLDLFKKHISVSA